MKEELEKRLLNKHINPTAMRVLVLELLENQQHAISLTEMEHRLAPADRTTIYRTLKTFEEKGLIHSIDDGTGVPKFALCIEDCDAVGHHDLHLHFYCTRCESTFCLPNTHIPKLQLPRNYQVQDMQLIVKGLCDRCSD